LTNGDDTMLTLGHLCQRSVRRPGGAR
jgi:hypothetical protein